MIDLGRMADSAFIIHRPKPMGLEAQETSFFNVQLYFRLLAQIRQKKILKNLFTNKHLKSLSFTRNKVEETKNDGPSTTREREIYNIIILQLQ